MATNNLKPFVFTFQPTSTTDAITPALFSEKKKMKMMIKMLLMKKLK